ncbi:MAG: alanine--glyoxylate aminotransferase family protein, partial [Acidobacteriota bacterium]
LLEDFGIEIGSGLGPFKGQAWRIGLMGHSSSRRNVMLVLSALGQLLAGELSVDAGAGVAAASDAYAASS